LLDEFPAVSRQVFDTFYSVSDDTLSFPTYHSLSLTGTESHIVGRASPLILNTSVQGYDSLCSNKYLPNERQTTRMLAVRRSGATEHFIKETLS